MNKRLKTRNKRMHLRLTMAEKELFQKKAFLQEMINMMNMPEDMDDSLPFS